MRRAAGISIAAVVAGATGVLALSAEAGAGDGRLSDQHVAGIAMRASARAGDRHPRLIQHVYSNRHHANLIDSGSGINSRERVFLIAIRGRFPFNVSGPPIPPGVKPPPDTGPTTVSVHTLIIDAHTGQVTDSGLSNHYPNLKKLGHVVTDLRAR